jgi:hypothetical protein
VSIVVSDNLVDRLGAVREYLVHVRYHHSTVQTLDEALGKLDDVMAELCNAGLRQK